MLMLGDWACRVLPHWVVLDPFMAGKGRLLLFLGFVMFVYGCQVTLWLSLPVVGKEA